jgi:uncharacterized protein YjiS (DUF1127 family)
MEADMAHHSEFDFSQFDFHAQTPERQRIVVRTVIRQAHADRAEEIAALARAGWQGISRIAAYAWRAGRFLGQTGGTVAMTLWRGYRERRQRRIAAAQLHAMDDRALRDIGLRRGEIEFVLSGATDPTRRPRSAGRRFSVASMDYASPSLQPAQRPDEFILARNGCAG